VAGRVSPGQALLTALAGLTGCEAGMPKDALLALAKEDPGEAFLGALALAERLAAEVRRLGGDDAALRARVYDKASELAYS
jgi:hypothetical protein